MEFVLRKAIDYGFDPVAAIQMATLNVAEHFSLDGVIGGIAPGRYADLVIIPDVQTIDAQMVISSGSVVAKKGTLLSAPRRHTFSKSSMNSIKLPRDMKPSDFIISTDPEAAHVKARIIDMVTDLVTAELEMQWPVINGRINPDVDQDVIKVAAIDRTHNPGNIYVGLIKGYGLKSGAMACSSAWDTSDIIVVGADDADAEQPSPGTQGSAEGDATAPSGGGQTSIGTSPETQPTPTLTFTQQDYGVMLTLVAAFVILIMSLTGRRGS